MKKVFVLFYVLCFIFSCGEETDCCVFPIQQNFEFEGDAQGCANFYVYKENNEEQLHLYIQGDRDALDLDLTEKEFSVTNENLKVEILKFDGPIGEYACDDVANDQGEVSTTWTATSGKVLLQIVEDSISVSPWEMTYKLTLKLREVQLENEGQKLATLSETDFKEVFVGWLPG